MNRTRGTYGTLALKPMYENPVLSVISGGKEGSSFWFDELAVQLFGFLHGIDFPSDVHDVLSGKTRMRLVSGVREIRFAKAVSIIALSSLFIFSFI